MTSSAPVSASCAKAGNWLFANVLYTRTVIHLGHAIATEQLLEWGGGRGEGGAISSGRVKFLEFLDLSGKRGGGGRGGRRAIAPLALPIPEAPVTMKRCGCTFLFTFTLVNCFLAKTTACHSTVTMGGLWHEILRQQLPHVK